MTEDPEASAQPSNGATADDRLDSWKEIAAYLKRDVTTVRRWEKREGLPVHRHLHARRDSVYGYRSELDAWWAGRSNQLSQNGANGTAAPWRQLSRAGLAWVLAGLFFVTTVTLTGLLVRGDAAGAPDVRSEVRFVIPPPEDTSFTGLSVSPDGRYLAFTALSRLSVPARPRLWIRSLRETRARVLVDTEDAAFPFWSPDGNALGFFASGKLWIVAAEGGAPRAICDAPNPRGGSWSGSGVILFARGSTDSIFRVSPSGGTPTAVTTVNRPNERGHVWPEFLPDGSHFLYLADSTVPEHHGIFLAALDGSDRSLLIPGASSNVAYGANGHLFFAQGRELVARSLDLGSRALTGAPIPIADRIVHAPPLDHRTEVSVSVSGTLVYLTMPSPATRLVWRDRANVVAPAVSAPGEYQSPALSPDGSRVVYDVFDPRPSPRFGIGEARVRSDLWLLDRSTGATTQVTSDPGVDWGAVWSPDGRRIVFSSNRSGRVELYEKDPGSSTNAETRLPSAGEQYPTAQAWSPDGRLLIFSTFEPKMRRNLWMLPMTGRGVPVPLLRTEFSEDEAQISPDGRWLAYASSESGEYEIYVRALPLSDSRWRLSTGGGGNPRWSADGRELFYLAADRRLMTVPVKTSGSFQHGAPTALFDTGIYSYWQETRNAFDLGRDGRFLFMKPVEDDRSVPLSVVVNWTPPAR